MTSPKYEIVVEAVRYLTDGQVDEVRVYERRGPAFSDRMLLKRNDLVQRMKAGQRVVAGERVKFMAGTFKAKMPVRLLKSPGGEVLVTTQRSSDRDDLQGIPLF